MAQSIFTRIGIGEMESFRNDPRMLKQIIRDGINDKELLPGEVIFAINWLDKKKFLNWVVKNSVNPTAKAYARRRIKQL